jgi:NADPH:quinone reductase-like Zn-dependent oxidoreductase
MQSGELPDAELRGPKDVVVQVHAASLNPVRWRP